MANEQRILELGQKVYLILNGVYNDVSGDEQNAFRDETIDWCNQYLDELEMEADWSWARTNGYSLGTVNAVDYTFTLDPDVLRLVSNWQRDIVMTRPDGQEVTWSLVSPNLIMNPEVGGAVQPNRAAVIGRKLRFSRPFTVDEIGSTLTGDAIGKLPRLSLLNVDILDLVQPYQLLVLGMAKNNVLPDVVNNTLAPNYDVKYQRMLRKAIELDGASTELEDTLRDDFSFIHGVY